MPAERLGPNNLQKHKRQGKDLVMMVPWHTLLRAYSEDRCGPEVLRGDKDLAFLERIPGSQGPSILCPGGRDGEARGSCACHACRQQLLCQATDATSARSHAGGARKSGVDTRVLFSHPLFLIHVLVALCFARLCCNPSAARVACVLTCLLAHLFTAVTLWRAVR